MDMDAAYEDFIKSINDYRPGIPKKDDRSSSSSRSPASECDFTWFFCDLDSNTFRFSFESGDLSDEARSTEGCSCDHHDDANSGPDPPTFPSGPIPNLSLIIRSIFILTIIYSWNCSGSSLYCSGSLRHRKGCDMSEVVDNKNQYRELITAAADYKSIIDRQEKANFIKAYFVRSKVKRGGRVELRYGFTFDDQTLVALCKSSVSRVLGIDERTLTTYATEAAIVDNRGHHQSHQKKDHSDVAAFLDKVPRVSSHYCAKKSKATYLSDDPTYLSPLRFIWN